MATLRLYAPRSGAQDFTIEEQRDPREWEVFRRTVTRYLKERGYPIKVIERFEKLPFELWRGTNGFLDDFDVLHVKVDMDTYIELENEVDHHPIRLNVFDSIADVMEKLGRPIRFIAAELKMENYVAPVQAPALETTSETVEAALKEAETLIGTHGASSAIDRAHTALHGYLEAVCRKAGIVFKEETSVADLFGVIRREHPSLRAGKPETKEKIDNILRGMARIMDALGLIRTQNSLAHPNPVLLDEPEAMLAINLMRTMLHYIDRRTRAVASA